MFRYLVVMACLAVPVLSYSSGAPEKICTNGLVPEHHVDPQSSAAPYSLSGAAGVKSGEKLSLTLGGSSFLGFAVQAHDASGHPIGQFKIVKSQYSQTLRCSGENDTLTHKKIAAEKPLKRLEFEWIAPANYKGKVRFVATVAENGGVFWVGKVVKDVTVQ